VDEEERLIVHAHHFVLDGEVSDDALADAYVTFLGHHELGMPWPTVPVADLLPALSALVWKEQTYGAEIVNETVAREATARWLSCFPPHCRAYTNGDVLLDHAKPFPSGGGCNTIIGAAFDTGAIVIAGDVIGMLWAVDAMKFKMPYESKDAQASATMNVLNSPLGQARLAELDANPALMLVRIIRAPIAGERVMQVQEGRDYMVSATVKQATVVVERRTDIPGDQIYIVASYGNLDPNTDQPVP
jgi:hypothetical protein